jgi:hypothetical protein
MSWPITTNLRGLTGATGATGLTGATGVTGATGRGVPVGGAIGYVLTKTSGADYDTSWQPSAGGGGGGGGSISFNGGSSTSNYANGPAFDCGSSV